MFFVGFANALYNEIIFKYLIIKLIDVPIFVVIKFGGFEEKQEELSYFF